MIVHYKDNMKQIMKEVIGKGKLVNNSLPKHLILNISNIFEQKTISNRKDHLRYILKVLTAPLKR